MGRLAATVPSCHWFTLHRFGILARYWPRVQAGVPLRKVDPLEHSCRSRLARAVLVAVRARAIKRQ